jgi:hypothetical protein
VLVLELYEGRGGESATILDNHVRLGNKGTSCRRGVDGCCRVAGINMGGGAGGIFEEETL